MIQCSICARKVDGVELFVSLAIQLAKYVAPHLIPAVIEALKMKFMTRGPLDSAMVAVANGFYLECPGCKKVPCWNAVIEQPVPGKGESL